MEGPWKTAPGVGAILTAVIDPSASVPRGTSRDRGTTHYWVFLVLAILMAECASLLSDACGRDRGDGSFWDALLLALAGSDGDAAKLVDCSVTLDYGTKDGVDAIEVVRGARGDEEL